MSPSRVPSKGKSAAPGPAPKTTNRPDEWKIEQGMSGAVLPVLDMTGKETKALAPQEFGPLTKDEDAIKAVGDKKKLFARERKGWKG